MIQNIRIWAQKNLRVRAEVPGDKSVSHRAVIFGALAEGTSVVRNLLESEDCLHTVDIFRRMGVRISRTGRGAYRIAGRGLRGLRPPRGKLDCGNSGTTMRLLMGLLAAQPFDTVLTGDASLSGRPMDRVIVPLQKMGARIEGRGPRRTAPIRVRGGRELTGIRYALPVASAQVKSAVLLAGLYAEGPTTVIEKVPTRDHTELFMKRVGLCVRARGKTVRLVPGGTLRPFSGAVPGDMSSAAFLLAAGILVPGSRAVVPNVLWNPTRRGFIEVLRRMKASLRIRVRRKGAMEETADLEAAGGPLVGAQVKAKEIPGLIDELPILMVLATQARGRTEIRGAGELRVKETDRIHSMVSQLRRMGARIGVRGDDIGIEGPTPLGGARIDSFGDHRTAMAFIVAGMIAGGETVVRDIAAIRTSFPDFLGILKRSGCRFALSAR